MTTNEIRQKHASGIFGVVGKFFAFAVVGTQTPRRSIKKVPDSLHPSADEYGRNAVDVVRTRLTDDSTFGPWTLERVVDAVRTEAGADWIALFWERYLNVGKVEERLGTGDVGTR